MADWGLLGGLAEGLKEGFTSYRDTKKAALDEALKKRSAQADLLSKGLEIDPETGEVVPTKLTAAKQAYDLGEYDKESDQSKRTAAFAGGVAKDAGLDNVDFSGMSGKEIGGENGIFGKALTAKAALAARQMSNDRFQQNIDLNKQKVENSRGRLDLSKDKYGSEAGQAVEKDPIVKQLKTTTNSLDRALSMLDGKEPVTAKNFAIIQQDMINAMAPGGAATEGKVNREMVETFAAHLNDLMLKFGSVQDLRKEQPEIFNQLKNQMLEIKKEYKKSQATQVNDITNSYKYSNVPQVKKTIKEKQDRYATVEDAPGLIPPQGLVTQPKLDEATTQKALEWANAHEKDQPEKAAAIKASLKVK
jgi:hypothetical protein